MIGKGQLLPNFTFGGYDHDMVQNTPYGAGATEPARKAADAAIAKLKSGAPIFATAIKDNNGRIVVASVPDGNYADVLNKMDYLVDGVVGSTH